MHENFVPPKEWKICFFPQIKSPASQFVALKDPTVNKLKQSRNVTKKNPSKAGNYCRYKKGKLTLMGTTSRALSMVGY